MEVGFSQNELELVFVPAIQELQGLFHIAVRQGGERSPALPSPSQPQALQSFIAFQSHVAKMPDVISLQRMASGVVLSGYGLILGLTAHFG